MQIAIRSGGYCLGLAAADWVQALSPRARAQKYLLPVITSRVVVGSRARPSAQAALLPAARPHAAQEQDSQQSLLRTRGAAGRQRAAGQAEAQRTRTHTGNLGWVKPTAAAVIGGSSN